ncbi:MAG TPA: hypothetical protein DCP90_02430 [Clostridiales bacterium]|nr:MAG: hypothetical protein A2Y22_07030 [Clostridiales bacterium GWD2_32_59]HAN09451.1 hypothetical protein [Clostridiales bacterium]
MKILKSTLTLRWIKCIKKYKMKYAILVLLSLLEIGVSVMQPIFLGKLIYSLTNKSYNEIISFMLLLFTFKALEIFFSGIKFYLLHYLRNTINEIIRTDIVVNILRKGVSMPITSINERLKEIADVTRKGDEIIEIGIKCVKLVVITIIITITANYMVGGIVLLYMVVYHFGINVMSRPIQKDIVNMKTSGDQYFARLHDLYEKPDSEKLRKLRITTRFFRKSRIFYNINYDKLLVVSGIIETLFQLLVYGSLGMLYFNNILTIDILIACITYFATITSVYREISMFNMDLKQLNISFARISELIE